ncbi:uncharacterized protein [Aristolochia californica]|uniref:uncharacterized protein n=1 Tax=Aristolochia californica TaxID=171875 RepID=UPI0035DABE8E
MGPNEPYWRTNTSFSPPLSRRWDYRFHPEGVSYSSHGGTLLYGSSLSSNSKESRTCVRGEQLPHHVYPASDGGASCFSSPSDSFHSQQWTSPPIQALHVNEFLSAAVRESSSAPTASVLSGEGTSAIPYSGGSTSFHSDNSEYESISKTPVTSHRNFSSRCSFMSKPVHPVAFSCRASEREVQETAAGLSMDNQPFSNELHWSSKSIQTLSEDLPTSQWEAFRWSSASSVDCTDVSDRLEAESLSATQLFGASKCALCDRFLSQRSPWSSQRIVRSGDMPVTSVLSCCHVYHAECLEQATPKTQKHDPPCPVCMRTDDDYFPDQRSISRTRGGLPWLRPFVAEEGPSRSWSCGQVGDCVEGALHSQTRNSMILLNRHRLKKQLSMKMNAGKEVQGKLKQSGVPLSRKSIDRAVECSMTEPGPAFKKW